MRNERRTATTLLASLIIAGAAPATITVDVDSSPTTGLAGFMTYTLSLSTDTGTISSLEGEFSGAMNQINPFTVDTIFTDNNAAFVGVGASVDQDSQFLFNSGDVLAVPGASESANNLNAAFTGFTPFASRDIAQIVVADGETVAYTITAIANGTEFSSSGTIFVPEPTSLALLGLGAVCVSFRRRRV